MAKLPILFGVFFILSSTTARLFPPNNEITYNYMALMQLSTEKPTLFTSELLVNAKLTLKTFEKQVDAILSDVDYSMYNGEGSHVGIDTKTVQIPPEAKSISQPFTIEYEKSGKVNGIKTQDNDHPWSVNIKKAIASTLQLDVEQILPKTEKTYAFDSNESTVYGNCQILYSILPEDNDDHFWVKKHNKPMTCKAFRWDTDFKVYTTPCAERVENPISLSSDRLYEVTRKDNGFLIDRVETINTILVAHFRGNSDLYSVMANQTLILVKAETLKDATPETFGETTQNLDIQCQHGPPEKGRLYEITGGRANYNETVLIENARKQLNRIIEDMDYTQSHFSKSTKYPDIEINMMLFQLRLLNEEQLKKLYDIVDMEHMDDLLDLVEKDTTPLLELALPHVGTHDSNMFIVKLIAEGDVPDKTAIKLLQRLPFHVRHPDGKLVKALMSLCDNENVLESVKSTAKIAASNVIHFITMKDASDEVANFYIDKFIDDFTKSEKYSDKLTYYSTLANIKTKKTNDFLEQMIINDKLNVTRHLRTLAIWALKDEYVKSMEYYDKIYWPILENEDEDTETRVAVMNTLMYNPSIGSLMKMHRLMEAEEDDELYNSYHTTLKTLSNSKLPCYKRGALNARKILAITKKPRPIKPMSFNFMTDYFDSVFGFGEMMRMAVVRDFKNDSYLSSYFQYSPFLDNLNINDKTLYIHLADEDEYLSNRLMYMDRITTYFDTLHDAIFGINYPVTSTSEFIWTNNGQITRTNITTFYGLSASDMGMEKNQQNYEFDQLKSGASFIPTELGLCTTAYLQTPAVSKLKESETRPIKDLFSFQLKAVKTFSSILGLGFYNPFANILHTIQRNNVRKFYFPLDVFGTRLNGAVKFTFNHTVNGNVEDFGFQTSVSSQAFAIGAIDKLKSTCADCDEFTVVTKGKEHLNKKTMWEDNLRFLGLSFKVEIFDCEREISEDEMSKLFESIANRDNKNFRETEPLYYLLTMIQLMTFVRLSPLPGMCAFRATAKPDHTHSTFLMGKLYETDPIDENKFDFHYGFKYEMFQENGSTVYWGCQIPQNMTKYDAAVSCTYKKGDNIFKACFKRKMHYGKEHLHQSDNIISIGKVDDEKICPENPTIEIHITRHEGDKLPDVFETINKTCTEEATTLSCIARHVISQKLTLDVKYEKISSVVEGPLAALVEWLKDEYVDSLTDVEGDYTKEGNLKINLLTMWKDFDMEVITSNNKFRLENVQEDISETFLEFDTKDLIFNIEDTDVCQLDNKYYFNAGGQKGFHDFTNKWSQIAAYDCNCPDKWELFAKREQFIDPDYNNTLEPWDFRIHSSGDNLELRSNITNLQVYLNDELLEESGDKGYYEGIWFKAKLYKYARVFVVSFKNFDRIILLDHRYERAEIVLPNEYLTNECHATRT